MSMKRHDPQAPVINWFIISKNYRDIVHKAELLDLCSPCMGQVISASIGWFLVGKWWPKTSWRNSGIMVHGLWESSPWLALFVRLLDISTQMKKTVLSLVINWLLEALKKPMFSRFYKVGPVMLVNITPKISSSSYPPKKKKKTSDWSYENTIT